MKVFISWSGPRSQAVAEILKGWIKCVLQASRPWLSTQNIDRGSLWFSEINEQLKDTNTGIVCLTKANQHKPWILFEAGALAKGISSNRVCTFLIDLASTDVQDPLAQFNHTLPNRQSMMSLVTSLNMGLGENRLDDHTLQEVFAAYWDRFKNAFDIALQQHPEDEKPVIRKDGEILAEILSSTRSMQARMRDLEMAVNVPRDTINSVSALRNRWFEGEPGSSLSENVRVLLSNGESPEKIIGVLKSQGFSIEEIDRAIMSAWSGMRSSSTDNKRKSRSQPEP